MDVTKMNLRRVKRRISILLSNYEEVIFGYHKHVLEEMFEKLYLYEDRTIIENEHGSHYDGCIWSMKNVTSGPDTCSCHFFRRRLEEAIEILKTYEKILSI